MKFTKETWRRALRTLVQVALSYIAGNILMVDFSAEGEVLSAAITGVVISALAAGLAAVMNLEHVDKEVVDEEVIEEDAINDDVVEEVEEVE